MRAARLAAAAAVLAGSAWPAAAGAASAGPPLRILAQTGVVTGSGTWRLALDTSAAPAAAEVSVLVEASLHSRSAFDQAAAGRDTGPVIYTRQAAVGAGRAEVDIPVDPPTPDIAAFHARGGSSVYPVEVRLLDAAGAPVGGRITTFLVYSGGPSTSTPPLAVALTVPVAGPGDPGATPRRLDGPDSARLAALAGALAGARGTPVTLDVSPDTAARLAAGGATDARSLAELAAAAGTGDQVLAEPYFPLDLAALHAAGLDAEVRTGWQEGVAALGALLRATPDRSTAAPTGGIDPTTVAVLAAQGVTHLALPAADLPPLPAAATRITYARPTLLETRGAPLPVVTDDAALSARLAPSADPQLAAAQLLAGLALVQLEAPSLHRGVALEVPGGQAPDPATLAAVLAGVEGDPFVEPTTLSGLFAAVPLGTEPISRSLPEGRPPSPLPLADGLRAARAAVAALGAIVPGRSRVVAPLERQLLAAASSAVGTAGRQRLLDAVGSAVRRAETGISLPGSSTVTLTGRRGTIPLTVLSTPAEVVRVALRLRSTKLDFLPWAPAGGTCQASGSEETCQLALDAEATTYRVPVATRTGGVFALDVVLTSPDGATTLAHDRDTVRSTAFSGVGVVLIVAAGIGLAWWWLRNIRHGRRARQLVEPPTGEVPAVPADDAHRLGARSPEEAGGEDPVAGFFAVAPPELGRVSPSGPPPGPTA